MCSGSLGGDISVAQLWSSPFSEILSGKCGPSEERDVPEQRPALEKISFQGKSLFFCQWSNFFAFQAAVRPGQISSCRGGSVKLSPGAGVCMSFMHPLTKYRCLGTCLRQGSVRTSAANVRWDVEVKQVHRCSRALRVSQFCPFWVENTDFPPVSVQLTFSPSC